MDIKRLSILLDMVLKLLLQFASLTILLSSCIYKQRTTVDKVDKAYFTYFEMSFQHGTSIHVDSNNFFIAPQRGFTVKNDGILPDTILNLINNTLLQIQKDTTIKSTYHFFYDCSLVAVKALVNKDTINLFQVGEISKPLYDINDKLESFLKSKDLKHLNAFMILETAKEVAPPLPPKIYK